MAKAFYDKWNTPNSYNTDFKEPPKASGIYALIHHDIESGKRKVLYIGSAKNLHQRYNRHEVRRILSKIYGYVQFYFKECPNYKEEEIKLIKSIKPPFNTQYTNE